MFCVSLTNCCPAGTGWGLRALPPRAFRQFHPKSTSPKNSTLTPEFFWIRSWSILSIVDEEGVDGEQPTRMIASAIRVARWRIFMIVVRCVPRLTRQWGEELRHD